jgi:nitrogen fixation protein NifQ
MFLSVIELNIAVPDGANADSVYQFLVRGNASETAEGFDLHVTACIFSLAIAESSFGQRSLSATTGLDPIDLAAVIEEFFPHVAWLTSDEPVLRGADEVCLLDLLKQCATDGTVLQTWLAAMIARRAQSPNHLWQDLGLRNRSELSRLMVRHFRPLAARNTSDMKWKKFLYRMICRDAGYSLCTAPSCSECCDFEVCFGDESGESRLARVRLADDLGSKA